MAKQQRMGWWFLCLACVVVMVCTAQRMAGLHALQMQATAAAAVVSAPSSTDDGSPVTPCELSAKSLLAAPRYSLKALSLRFVYCFPYWRLSGSCACRFRLHGLFRRPHYGYIYDFVSSVNDRPVIANG